jgi:very-short-patch-repair endonuclease
VVTPVRLRSRPGLRVRQDRLAADEVCDVDGIAVTAPLRTAYDLARRESLVDAVVAVDALARRHGFPPRWVVRFGYRHLGARGSARLPQVAALADARSGSPMETRVRLAVVLAGLPTPVPQHPVGPYLLDLAYPRERLAVEYDGAEHREQRRARRDLERRAYLTARGWRVLRFDADVVLRAPHVIATTVDRELRITADRTSAL